MGSRGRRSDDGLSDALPNSMIGLGNYRDTGCVWHPKCLTCPFEKCRYELAGTHSVARASVRDVSIREAHLNGEPVDAIALRFKVTRRTVYRALERVEIDLLEVEDGNVVGIAGGQSGA